MPKIEIKTSENILTAEYMLNKSLSHVIVNIYEMSFESGLLYLPAISVDTSVINWIYLPKIEIKTSGNILIAEYMLNKSVYHVSVKSSGTLMSFFLNISSRSRATKVSRYQIRGTMKRVWEQEDMTSYDLKASSVKN